MRAEKIKAWELAAAERGQFLRELIKREAPRVQQVLPAGVNAEALLIALAKKESSFGVHGGWPRREDSYRPGGKFYENSRHVQALYRLYGDCAASSWSSWQIMYPVAVELGFLSEPWTLWDDREALRWVTAYLRRAVKRGATDVFSLADAYNSGSHKDRFVPQAYISAVQTFYNEALEETNAADTT